MSYDRYKRPGPLGDRGFGSGTFWRLCSRLGNGLLALIWVWVALRLAFADGGSRGDSFATFIMVLAALACLALLMWVRGEEHHWMGSGRNGAQGQSRYRRQGRIIADRRWTMPNILAAKEPSRPAKIVGEKRSGRRGRLLRPATARSSAS
jgi:hypothetical protein